VLALKNFLGLEAEIHALDYFKAEQLRPQFAELNPNRRMPVLEEDGWVLWESNAILFYLASGSILWPRELKEQADVVRWLAWESSHWDPAWDMVITERVKKRLFVTSESGRRTEGMTTDPRPADSERLSEGTRYVTELAGILDAHLTGRRWLVGNGPTIAEFAVAAWLPTAEPAGLAFDSFEAIKQWYAAVSDLPGWRNAIPLPGEA
jgi:glutathione S-transferase